MAVVTQTQYMYEEAHDHTSEYFRNTKFSSGLRKVELLLRATLATKTKNMLRLWLGSGVSLFLSKVFFYIYVCTASRANLVA